MDWQRRNMTLQMNAFDAKLDWDRELKTSGQNIIMDTVVILQLYKNKLALPKFSEVNWDPVDKLYWLMNKLMQMVSLGDQELLLNKES